MNILDIIFLLIGLFLGSTWREQRELRKKFMQMNKTEVTKYGVTKGSYATPKKASKNSAIVNPKTPSQLEYEKNLRENTIGNSNEDVKSILEKATHNYEHH